MKKFLSIALAVLMLVPLCIFNVAGAEESNCTYKRSNVAAAATVSTDAPVWMVNVGYLTDGDRSKGTAANSGVRTMSYTFEFASATLFDEVVMVVNGKGDLPSSWQSFAELSNNDYPITLKMYNGDNEVYSYGPVQTGGRIEISTADDGSFAPVTATKIVITIQNNNDNHKAALWEVEAYSGSTGKHDWKEGTTVESTCKTAGYIPLSCACGATSKTVLPLSNDHKWDNGTVKTPATESTDGVKEYKCTVCQNTKEVTIPATAHNAFDEGVVTAPTCTEMGYTTYTCTHCSSYTYKDNYVNALGHDMDDGVMSIKPTFTSKGEMTYTCQRTGCSYSYKEELPAAWYQDSEFKIGDANATVTEEITGTPFANSSTEVLFDGTISANPVNNPKETNYWKAPAGEGASGKLIIEFDYEYIITSAKFHIYGNSLGFTIEMFDADGTSIYKTEKSGFAVSSAIAEPVVVSDAEIMGKMVKKVVITSTNQYGKSPWVSEVAITAHKCLYDDADKTNIVNEPTICKTTFDGTCWMCGEARTGVVEYNHTFEKETGTEIDKIYTTSEVEGHDYKEATCYTDGKGYKHCTVCNVDVDTIIPATGNHDFENGAPVYDDDKAPTCGEGSTGHKKCATEGCTAVSEDCNFPATGEHSKWSWKVIPGQEPDYTHTGLKGYYCGVCGYKDTSKEDQVAAMEKLNCVTQKDWSIRYTDFISARATFKINKNNIEAIDDEFDVKIFGVVQKGEVTKEVQVYGEGATGKVGNDGTFSLVVKGASYTDEYKFSVRIEITCKDDNTKAESTVTSKNLTTAPDGTVSAKNVAEYFLAPNRVDALDAEVKKLYETIVG